MTDDNEKILLVAAELKDNGFCVGCRKTTQAVTVSAHCCDFELTFCEPCARRFADHGEQYAEVFGAILGQLDRIRERIAADRDSDGPAEVDLGDGVH